MLTSFNLKSTFCCLALGVIFLTGCRHKAHQIDTSFYYWRHDFRLEKKDQTLLDSLQVKKLYVKYFDLDWDKATMRLETEATITFATSDYQHYSIIPVIYITTATLTNTKQNEIKSLADSISKKIDRINIFYHLTPSEIQVDCDWTIGTKSKYFALLREIKAQTGVKALSCTIRLHQVKYKEKTGVPPVDRGMLMFYNMGKVENTEESNSIYDPVNAGKYIEHLKDYPLPLDVALPLYSWAVRYTDGRAQELLNGMTVNDFKGNPRFHPDKENWYIVDSPGYMHGYYFKDRDRIRVEEITPDVCKKAASQLSGKLRTNNFTIAFFDLQAQNTKRYALSDFQEICDILR